MLVTRLHQHDQRIAETLCISNSHFQLARPAGSLTRSLYRLSGAASIERASQTSRQTEPRQPSSTSRGTHDMRAFVAFSLPGVVALPNTQLTGGQIPGASSADCAPFPCPPPRFLGSGTSNGYMVREPRFDPTAPMEHGFIRQGQGLAGRQAEACIGRLCVMQQTRDAPAT
ncbi:hypothetical protein N658DRAFT_110565 [Parathielavia hyrcaniae]|uniref:Uncharacterized protein n=1 Tax=Parathielavia hyrcaniae TaxID=113614 RepID=A0AAN6Q7W7_9PEZI|nr:hypothetical protein N658DRAFT_110565 [Parathielavia hyrcaniae]